MEKNEEKEGKKLFFHHYLDVLKGENEKYITLNVQVGHDRKIYYKRFSLHEAKSLVRELNHEIKELEQLDAFVMNEHLMLKLEHGRTEIYVNGVKFRQCKSLLINIPQEEIPKYDQVESIDEALGLGVHENTHGNYPSRIDPKTEYWGHCSNLQAWVDNEYNTALLHRNLAFPLLKKLVEVGDPNAKKAYRDEIISRLESNEPTIALYLVIGGYLDEFNEEEMEIILENLSGFTRLLVQARLQKNLEHYLANLKIDEKHAIISLERGEILLCSSKSRISFHEDFQKTVPLNELKTHARALFRGSLIDFGIRVNQRKIAFSTNNIRLVMKYFKNKELLLSIPRGKAPLKIHHENEDIIAYIRPKEVY